VTRARFVAASAVTIVAALVAATPAAAVVKERVTTVATPPAPGPSQYNQVTVHEFGSKSADHVLVLMPGTDGGAGDFTLDGQWLAKNVPDLQVWAVDRRENALEDTAMFEQGLAGTKTLQEVFDYYLGWITGATPPTHYQFLDSKSADFAFAKEWGMEVALDDVHAVIAKARKQGHDVILGGHSVGASLAISYAAWDFNGEPGYKDLAGTVLIDGGLLGSFDPYNLAQAQEAVEKLNQPDESPFYDLIGLGFPEAAGLFAEVGSLYAKLAPTADGSTLQNFPLLPEEFKPPVPATNRGIIGYAFDRDTSPADLGLLHINGGSLDTSVQPADWADANITPVSRIADTFGQEPTNAVDWFFPRRITIDANGADQMKMNDVGKFLGLRLEHTSQIDLPFYVFQTDDTGGDVLKGARNFIKRTKTAKAESTLVNRDPQTSHLDPLIATPAKNDFLKTVKPFLIDAFGE
jgi:pimeloyl-ACP methyl ester carboxylesterase